MAGFVIDADGHVMEQHKDLFDHIKGNFGEMNWHATWPMFDADGWQRGLSRKGKREDPDAEAWIRFQNEHAIDCAVLYPTSALGLGMIQLPAWASALAPGSQNCCRGTQALCKRSWFLRRPAAIRHEQQTSALRLSCLSRNLR